MNLFTIALIAAAGPGLLPDIDRRAIEMQARAEQLQASRPAPARRNPAPRRAAGGGNLDMGAITTICRAAGGQADPAAFISTLSRAYALSSEEDRSLRSSCAAYLAGQADARRTGGLTY
jgi:hypothetical protein